MVHTPRTGTSDSLGWFRRCECSTLLNYYSNLSMCDTFLIELLPPVDNRRLLTNPKETFDLNWSPATLIISHPNTDFLYQKIVHPVPEKTRFQMVIEIHNAILDGQSSCLFSNDPFEKIPVTTIEDFVLHPDDHFESHLLGEGLYNPGLLPSPRSGNQIYSSFFCTWYSTSVSPGVCVVETTCILRAFCNRQTLLMISHPVATKYSVWFRVNHSIIRTALMALVSLTNSTPVSPRFRSLV